MPNELVTRLDHVAIGMPRIADAVDILVGRLGGRADSGGPGGGFRWACWRYEGGGRIEVIEPAGANGFLHRFLAAHGPGVHHVTFKVSSLADACLRAEALGYRVVGRDESDPGWRVAYLHPKEALGIVIQLAQPGPGSGRRPWEVPPGPPDAPPPAHVLGLRTRVRSAARARTQWEEALGGRLARETREALMFRWPESPMRITALIAPGAEEGPVAIELGEAPEAAVPVSPVAPLGTAFVVDRDAREP